MNTITQVPLSALKKTTFPLDQWYVAGFSWELKEQPIARTFLNQPVVLFRTGDGEAGALEDRCCHRSLPLSCGMVEGQGLRCGYHGLLYDTSGACIEIPGQGKIPSKARVRAYTLVEKNHILWIWMPKQQGGAPTHEPPEYPHHEDPKYKFGGGVYHYDAPYQLIHDNLLDLSHVGYVHAKTIGGNAKQHMTAEMKVSGDDSTVSVVRLMPGTPPPPSYTAAWPFKESCDRWQEIEFHPSHLRIWTGAIEPGGGLPVLEDPQRGGLHLRGFHGITPETETTSHYFWSMASNKHPDMPETIATVLQQIEYTFDEDRVIIKAQYENMQRFGDRASWLDIHVDAGANRARRIIAGLLEDKQEL
ncbi:Rieske 2Fe-2S domain-containing protein [Undibacterium sp.]|uniref:Rieske 2Fe-2S domain-containing protein n=1 Tax=Undibacterium sp. TaxID=1914977 RepID=UPI00374CD512